MTYHNAVKYILSAPTADVGSHSYDRIAYMSALLGEPHKSLNYIRLAGSNGKTICSALTSAILCRAGYTVCSLNMSVLDDIKENIRINSTALSISEFTGAVQTVCQTANLMRHNLERAKVALLIEEELDGDLAPIPQTLLNGSLSPDLTQGEILLLCALILYKEKNCNLCIIESSNTDNDPSLFLKPPSAAVICGAIPNSDPTQMARIKTYIQRGIKEVISAPQDPLSYKMISDSCAAINCRLSVPIRSQLILKQLSLIGTTFIYNSEEYRLGLCGRFQTTNAITVIETVKVLRRMGYNIPQDAEHRGLSSVRIRSRFEVLSVNPTIIADSTYKTEAIETVCESLFDFSEITGRRITLCLPPNSEMINTYLDMLGARGYTVERIYTITHNNDETETLTKELKKDIPIAAIPSPKAIKHMLGELLEDALLLISGRHYFTDNIRTEIIRYMGF